MKIGKVSQTVLKRSILKQLKMNRPEAVITPSVEEMCAAVEFGEGMQSVFTTTILYGGEKDLGVFALAGAVNDLATRGAEPVGVTVNIQLPPHAYESRLKSMVSLMEQAAAKYHIQILSARAEVNPIISQAMVSLTGIGAVEKGRLIQSSMGRAGQEIVLTGWIGLEGTCRVLRAKEEDLAKRFVPSFMQRIRVLDQELFALEPIRIAKQCGVSAMHQITGGGILAALWEVSEASGVGLEVSMKNMSIKQETIEVCEYFHLNPYQLTSAGSILMLTDDGEALVQQLQKEGQHAEILGYTTSGNDRVIRNGEERRFLDRPAQDELIKIYDNR